MNSKLLNAGIGRISSCLPAFVGRFWLTLSLTVFAIHAMAQQAAGEAPVKGTTSRYLAGQIRSIADADAALAEAAKGRAEIETRYAAEEQACHPKFFATSCIEEAKERRRRAMSELRPVEIEANTYKRQARVIYREKVLAERLAKSETERQERIKQQQASENTADKPSSLTPDEPAREAQAIIFPDRVKEHEEKMKRLQAEGAADAKKRVENIAAYERKQQAALMRQQQVAERKAQKEEKRRKKQGTAAAEE